MTLPQGAEEGDTLHPVGDYAGPTARHAAFGASSAGIPPPQPWGGSPRALPLSLLQQRP